MGVIEYRAYDVKGKTFIYDRDPWLPKGLKKLGHNEHPVTISQEGIHYTLDCLSNHYENDWEEEVVALLDIKIMQCTNLFDYGVPHKKMYCNDIVSFTLPDRLEYQVGRIQLCEQSGEWILVDKHEQFLKELRLAVQPQVIGNWFDNPELLG